MRIAFVAQPFDHMVPPVQGGSLSIWIDQVARRCARRGHDVFVFGNHGGRLRAQRTRYEDVEYIFTPTLLNGLLNRAGDAVAGLVGRVRGEPADVPSFAAAWRDTGYAAAVGRYLRRLDCDAVLVMNYTQLVPVIRRAHPRARICLYMQCEWLTQLDRTVMGKRMDAADLVSGCSEYIKRTIASHFPEHGAKCRTLNNAAPPPSRADRSERQPRNVLFVGRVSPEKGVHVLIEAFHAVLERFPDARLRLVGGVGSAPLEFLVGLSDDPKVAALRRFYEPASEPGKDPYLVHLERAAGAELGSRIVFEGRVDYDRTSAAYRRASLVVNPSLSESFGMALVEAMTHGVPVVASRVGGMTYTVDDGVTGRLVEADDAQALAAAMIDILGDDAKAARMGESGRQRATDHFSWDSTTETLITQFEAVRR